MRKRKIMAREIVMISSLIAIAVLGRTAFFMTPQFKPMGAIIIISAVVLGSRIGFLIGTMSAFISNFFFGQGPWTIWQMIGFGMVGLVAGLLFKNDKIINNKILFSFLSGSIIFFIYGGIINLGSILMYSVEINIKESIAVYLVAIPFDLIHAFSTVIFVYIIGKPFIKKIKRVKIKYGMFYN